jgi:hypothetical protein
MGCRSGAHAPHVQGKASWLVKKRRFSERFGECVVAFAVLLNEKVKWMRHNVGCSN